MAERFQREARAAAGLSGHPNVVTIYDVGEHEGRIFMTMERLTGGSLADVLRRGRVDPAQAIALAAPGRARPRRRARARRRPPRRQARQPAARRAPAPGDRRLRDRAPRARALRDEDRAGVRHRRLHRARAGGGPAGHGRERPLRPGRRRLRAPDGERPLPGRRGDRPGRASTSRRRRRRRASARPTCRRAVDAVLLRALAKDPDERWPTARAFVDALERALEERPAPRRSPIARGR